jgi:actin-related protein 8
LQQTSSLADTDKVLIIHPGSRYLRFGRATDNLPIEIPNCIARKSPNTANGLSSSSSSSTRYRDLSEEKLEILRLDLRARMRILKLRGTTGGSIAASDYNKAVVPEDVPFETDENYLEWTDPSGNGKSVYFGEDAMHLANPEKDGWIVKWPYLKGTFNTKDYTSSREMLGDIADMWIDALEKFCLIPPNKLEEYSVILLIPDLYDHTYITEMCDMMLKTIGFAQVILHQVPNVA